MVEEWADQSMKFVGKKRPCESITVAAKKAKLKEYDVEGFS